MNGIVVKKLSEIGQNENGSTFGLATRPAEGFIVAQRKKGSKSGGHYHKGNSDTKNPEILILTSGSAKVYGSDRKTGETFHHEVDAPVELNIYPNVIHTVEAVTDISFIEFNSLDEHKADTFYED
jgi:hypothetical protein